MQTQKFVESPVEKLKLLINSVFQQSPQRNFLFASVFVFQQGCYYEEKNDIAEKPNPQSGLHKIKDFLNIFRLPNHILL